MNNPLNMHNAESLPKEPIVTNQYPALIEDVWQRNASFSGFALFFAVTSIILFIVFAYSNLHGYISDEGYHAKMIDALLRKEWNNLPTNVTTPPFFHAIVALFIHISGAEAQLLELMRFIQLTLSLGAIPCFYFIAVQLRKNDCDFRLLLCLVLPLYAPLLNLVYTDPPAITFTMLMVFFMLRGNHWLAAIIAIAGIGVRQMTVIWACFCAIYVIIDHIENYSHRTSTSSLSFFKAPIEIFKLAWVVTPYLLPAVAFISYTLYNGGVVAGDKVNHSTTFNASNLFFFLIVSAILFIPYLIDSSKKVVELIIKQKWVWVLIPSVFILYLSSYEITHVYNNPDMSWWIHNQLLAFSTQTALIKALFFIPVIWMLLTFIVYALTHPKPWQMFTLYGFALLSFVPLPLVEARYYIVALLLFLLWKPRQSDWAERINLLYLLGLSFYVINGASTKSLFL